MAPTCACRPVRIQYPTAIAVPPIFLSHQTLPRCPSSHPKTPSAKKHWSEGRGSVVTARTLPASLAEFRWLPFLFPQARSVSSYFAIGDEADPSSFGIRTAAPRPPDRCYPGWRDEICRWIFILWEEGRAVARGGFGLSEPSRDWPILAPDVLIVPLLAFDRQGYRIGYGAGYYDRTS